MRGIVLGTGPSVTPEVIAQLQKTDLPIFGCNNAYQVAPLKALLSCNPEWWDYYWQDANLKHGDFEKWTWDLHTSEKYGIAHIEGRWGDGLSTDPGVIYYGHSSGYQLVNMAYHYGVLEMVLIGYDLTYGPNYNGMKRITGGNRHYFGEYPPELQHFTKFNMGENGEINGLLDCYRTIKPEDYGLRIINCSPGTALDFFETGNLEDWI